METIEVETDARGVATLTLNRPDKHNALSALMISELTDAARALGADPAVRVVVLTGAGPTFCAGGDLGWMREQMRADAKQRRAAAMRIATIFQTLNTLPKPLIGALQGNAFGGGVGLACVCDLAIGVTDARFGLTETRLGLIPATIGPYVVARLGEAMARRVFMSSRLFDATEALTLGVIARAVAPADLADAVAAEVAPYLVCAPRAVAAAKAQVRALGPVIDDATIGRSIDALATIWEGSEAAEGIAAFFERRKANWSRDT
mgnify:CR=1 FL=1